MKTILTLLFVLLFAFWLRGPFIRSGLPYFYDEDEAHHFNRIVEMVKTGSYNPNYFHKPSAHFYLRMPVVAASFLWSVKKGYLKNLNDIKTRDKFGLAGYSFKASPPSIAKWNRALSLFLSLLTVAIVFSLTHLLLGKDGTLYSFAAALLVSVSPDLASDSSKIGVDVLLTFMCSLCALFSVFVSRNFSLSKFILLGLLCGLTVSTKYNALPIIALPFLLITLRKDLSPCSVAIALVSPVVGFLVGSPFVLVSLPLFLDHLAYEIWHYAIAGHENHTGEPGIHQTIFYLKWLAESAIGVFAFLIAFAGIAVSFLRLNTKEALLILIFPMLFLLEMSLQKVNFVRNMLPVIPFFAVYFSIALSVIGKAFGRFRILFVSLLILAGILQPFIATLTVRSAAIKKVDSRIEAAEIISTLYRANKEISISGQLQIYFDESALKGVHVFDERETSIESLYNDGYDIIVCTNNFPIPENFQMFVQNIRLIKGAEQKQRVLDNPTIKIIYLKQLNLSDTSWRSEIIKHYDETLNLNFDEKSQTLICNGGYESYCWLKERITLLVIPPSSIPEINSDRIRVIIEAMSPWEGQELYLITDDLVREIPLKKDVFDAYEIEVGSDMLAKRIYLGVSMIHSPKSYGISTDARRLGAAIKSIRLDGGLP